MDKNEKRASRFVKSFPVQKDATHASFPQIYSNNKKGGIGLNQIQNMKNINK